MYNGHLSGAVEEGYRDVKWQDIVDDQGRLKAQHVLWQHVHKHRLLQAHLAAVW